MEYIVELSDSEGKSCRLKLDLPVIKANTNVKNSKWKVLDEGCLKFRSGGCKAIGEWCSPLHLLFYANPEKTYGIILYEFTDSLRIVNDSGNGRLTIEWASGLAAGDISWVVLE